MCTLFETSNDDALCCILNHGNTLEQLLHCLFLFFCQLESTLPHTIICDFRTSLIERISRPRYEPLYTTNTSHHKQDNVHTVMCSEMQVPKQHVCNTQNIMKSSNLLYFLCIIIHHIFFPLKISIPNLVLGL
jgi:hypothetical protein